LTIYLPILPAQQSCGQRFETSKINQPDRQSRPASDTFGLLEDQPNNNILSITFYRVEKENEMSSEQILVWIVIGGIAGILAEALVGGLRSGLLGAIVVGILGAIIGGWLFGVLGLNVGTGILAEIIKALIGAALLLLILRGTRRL